MNYLIFVALLATLTGCSTLSSQSNPLDPKWTHNKGQDLVPVRQERQDNLLIRHYHVFNAPAQLASLNGFTQTSAQQRAAELSSLCADRGEADGNEASVIRYEYYWGSHENHPLLSEFSIKPGQDCPS